MHIIAAQRPEAMLTTVLRVRCPHCFKRDGTITPNPEGLSHCPRCGGRMPDDKRHVHDAVVTMPLAARALYAIGNLLRRLAARLQ